MSKPGITCAQLQGVITTRLVSESYKRSWLFACSPCSHAWSTETVSCPSKAWGTRELPHPNGDFFNSTQYVSCFAGNKQNQHFFIPDGLIVSILYDTFQLETSNYEGSMVIVVTVCLHLVINLRSHILLHCLICMPSCRAVRASHYKERVLN